MAHRMGVFVVIALVALNVFVVPMAFRSVVGSPDLEPAPPDRESTAPARETPSPESSPPESSPPDSAGPVMLASVGQRVVRATPGRCGGTTPSLEVSTDGGGRFTDVAMPGGATQVLAVEALSLRRVALTALDRDCDPVRYLSDNQGGDWSRKSTDGHWSRGGDERQLLSPNGAVDVPCRVVDLSMIKDDYVRVLCPDGRVLRTFDDLNWTVAGTVEGAQAIRFPLPDIGYALARRGRCAATVLRTVDSGATWERLNCLTDEPGRAITGQDGRYVAQAGSRLFVSTDGGETWTRL